MWYNGTVTAARKLRIAYNISLRRLFCIPKYNSASEMFVQLNNNNNIFIHTCYNCIEQYIPINNNILRIIKHVMLNI